MTITKKTAEFDYRDFLLSGDKCRQRLEEEMAKGDSYAKEELSDLQKRQFSNNY